MATVPAMATVMTVMMVMAILPFVTILAVEAVIILDQDTGLGIDDEEKAGGRPMVIVAPPFFQRLQLKGPVMEYPIKDFFAT